MPLSDIDLLVDPYADVKISILTKLSQINSTCISDGPTLGPHSVVRFNDDSYDRHTDKSAKETDSNDPIKNVLPEIIYAPSNTNTNSNALIKDMLLDLETERQYEVERAVKERAKIFEEFSRQQNRLKDERAEKRHKQMLRLMREQGDMIELALKEFEREMLEQKQEMDRYYEILEEKRKQDARELEELERKKQKLISNVNAVKKEHGEFCTTYQKIMGSIKSCSEPLKLKDSLGEESVQKMKTLSIQMDEIIKRCKAKTVEDVDCSSAKKVVEELKDVLELVKKKIEILKKEQIAAAKPPVVPQKQEVAQVVVPTEEQRTAPPPPPPPVLAENQLSQLSKFVSKTSLVRSSKLQSFFENYSKSFQVLSKDPNLKQFKFDCQKAVNIPVNAISATSAAHLIDKYNRLHNLLTGKTVPVGEKFVCATSHPEGLPFCTNLLARKFVVQADLMVSSSPDAAYSYAAVMVALWNDNDDFGRLLLNHFYTQCPYLIPMFIPPVEEKSRRYYLSCGYQYTDDGLESQDKFLKRMGGLMKLYAAVLVTRPKRGHRRNRLGLAEGWRWLAAFLNLDPHPDISSTMLFVFLETCGWALQEAYGKAFSKMISYICGEYFQLLRQFDSGGPIVRLEGLLKEFHRSGKWPVPEALLPDNFW